ncbi:MAG: hypothetical protein KDC34_11800 [Saprospiraceae bacterium]|nr:hypothetical protein [Saprospiraceae bacterium]
MDRNPQKVIEDQLLLQLKDVLLREDRVALQELRSNLEDPVQLEQRVGPLIEYQLGMLRSNFPEAYYNVVDKMIQARLKVSQGEIMDTIYPVLGKMIKKYVQMQFLVLREELSAQIYLTLNTGLIGRIKYAVFGMSKRDEAHILARAKTAKVDEVFIIEQHSGILRGSASRKTSIDSDLVAGMLTAIKSFVEDAFKSGNTDLEKITYGNHSIHVFNYYTCYIAVVVSGQLTAEEEAFLNQRTNQFGETSLLNILRSKSDNVNLLLRNKLEKVYFFDDQEFPIKSRNAK